MPNRPQVPALSFTPETLMGDCFRITRKLAPALPFLSQFQIIRLRQELAIVELLVNKHVDQAVQLHERFAAGRHARRFFKVLEFPTSTNSPRAA